MPADHHPSVVCTDPACALCFEARVPYLGEDDEPYTGPAPAAAYGGCRTTVHRAPVERPYTVEEAIEGVKAAWWAVCADLAERLPQRLPVVQDLVDALWGACASAHGRCDLLALRYEAAARDGEAR